MTDWQAACLTAMAVALVAMAILQVVAVFAAMRVARQVTTTAEELRREIRPLVEQVRHIADDAARMTRLGAAQVERVDHLLASVSARVEETLELVHGTIAGPLRHGGAIVTAIGAALSVLQAWRRRSRPAADEDDAMFVG